MRGMNKIMFYLIILIYFFSKFCKANWKVTSISIFKFVYNISLTLLALFIDYNKIFIEQDNRVNITYIVVLISGCLFYLMTDNEKKLWNGKSEIDIKESLIDPVLQAIILKIAVNDPFKIKEIGTYFIYVMLTALIYNFLKSLFNKENYNYFLRKVMYIVLPIMFYLSQFLTDNKYLNSISCVVIFQLIFVIIKFYKRLFSQILKIIISANIYILI